MGCQGGSEQPNSWDGYSGRPVSNLEDQWPRSSPSSAQIAL